MGVNIYDYCSEMAGQVAPDEQNIIFLPHIFASNYNPQAKATFVRAHIIRAVYEGIVFCHMVHLEKFLANRKATKAVRLA